MVKKTFNPKYNTQRGRFTRREGMDLNLFSSESPLSAKIKLKVTPGGKKSGNNVSNKLSEYGKQLRAKQMVKRSYGILEKPFRNCFKKANKMKGSTGSNLLIILETSLCNVIFVSGFARTRREAKQIISHGGVLVNGNKVDISSYALSINDLITLNEKTNKQQRINESIALSSNRNLPVWLDIDTNAKTIKLNRMPERDDISPAIMEHLIVELYSK